MKKPDPAHADTDKIIEQMEKEISKEYRKAHEEIAEKLADYLRRFEKKDRTWRKWVEEGKKTQAEYTQWRKGQILISKRWEDMKNDLAEDYLNAHKIAESIVRGHMPEVYALNHNYATFEVEKGSQLDTNYSLYSRETVESLFRGDRELYKSPGAKVQQAIKDGRIKRWERSQIQSVMIQGVLQGESIPNLTRRLEKVTGGEHAAAIRNARTMATGVQNAGRMDAYKRAEGMGIQVKKKWLATLDSRTRHWHRDLDGVTLPVDKPFENDFGKIMFPGDATADGANIYNCRCTLLTVIPGFEIDTSNTDLRHDKNLKESTYEEWKNSHDVINNPITLPEEKEETAKWEYIREYMGFSDGSSSHNSTQDGRIKGVKSYNRTGNLSAADYARAKYYWECYKELDLPPEEREEVISNFNNNLTYEERKSPFIQDEYGVYRYFAINKGFSQYKIYKKEPIEPYKDWMDEIMSETVGINWRNYEE